MNNIRQKFERNQTKKNPPLFWVSSTTTITYSGVVYDTSILISNLSGFLMDQKKKFDSYVFRVFFCTKRLPMDVSLIYVLLLFGP